ncbi:sulfurtransferase [Arhodomonas aquaeolei]|uniref:sulfurtransferase n=1 Tax=Arhodomonas aquaeolei TaxID=2369 RepID=UPI002167AC7F|nr:sulfurtransferase [Arhodomonas aquaeolei]MCS4504376.1 sulfurtransferase [Arhodomonas aquaeolei]
MANKRLPLLVEPETLAESLDTPGLLIVDLSDADAYERAHIPGAVHLRYSDILRQEGNAKGLMADVDTLSRVLSGLGMRSDCHVLACDNEGNGRASRFLWTLDALGHHDYSLLDGGMRAWVADGYATESGPSPSVPPSEYHAALANPDVVADKAFMLEHVNDDNTVILDARSPAEYAGEDVRAARGGHIPGAVNLEWTEVMDPQHDSRLLPPEALREVLMDRGVTPDREVVTHCQTHHRSGLTFFVMRYLGYPRVRGYAGSWSEWGNDPDVPITAGDRP